MKNNGQAIFGTILFIVLTAIFLGCSMQNMTLKYNKTMEGWNTNKIKVSERRARKINSLVKYPIRYANDTLYLEHKDYIDNVDMFQSGLLKNREIRKANKSKQFEYSRIEYYKVIQDLGQYDQVYLGLYRFKKTPVISQEIPVGEKRNKLKIIRIDEINKIVYVK